MFTRGLSCIAGRDAFKINSLTSARYFHAWRKKKGIEQSPIQYSPLTLLPDYSYVDGRPVPLSETRLEKVKLQKKYCERIIELSHEIDVAVEHYNEKQKQQQQEKKNIINNKLKAKGDTFKSKKK